jgi:MFS transporter, AAHS family, 4-hydroxybenzoate transporter
VVESLSIKLLFDNQGAIRSANRSAPELQSSSKVENREEMAVSSARIEVASVIDNRPISGLQLIVFVSCFFIMAFDGFDTQAMAFVAPAISKAWGASAGTFGPVFSAALFGGMVGGISLGYLADRLGRRLMLAICVAIFGALNVACAYANSIEAIIALRFLSGIGLGGAIPNTMAMISEFAPAHRRTTLIAMTWCGFALGAVLGGFVSIPLITHFGWPSVLFVGGIVPVLAAPFIAAYFPESIKFLMVAPQRNADAVRAIMRRIDPTSNVRDDAIFVLDEVKAGQGSALAIFRNGLAIGSIFLCLALFMSLLVVYCLLNWIPLLLNQAGLPMSDAIMGTILFNLAGIPGSFLCTWMIDRKIVQPLTILISAYFLGAISVAFIGYAGTSFWPLMISIFISGFLIIGVQLSLNAVITTYFPTALRGTGGGWSVLMGRAGALSGPLFGGLIVASGSSPSQMFAASAIAPLCACLSLITFVALTSRRDRKYSSTPPVRGAMSQRQGTT